MNHHAARIALLLWALAPVGAAGSVAAGGVAAGLDAPSVAHLTTSPYPKVRIAAALRLARCADGSSLDRLERLLADPHPLVRLSAAHGLRRRGRLGPLAALATDSDAGVRALAHGARAQR